LVEIDPASSWCWWMRGVMAYYRRDYECMAESGLEALDLSPHDPPALWIASGGLAQCGEIERARSLVAQLEEVAGQWDMFLGIAGALRVHCGQPEIALAHGAELERRAVERPVSPFIKGFIPSNMGNVDPALDALEAAYNERNMLLWGISRDRAYDYLRSHPRFKRIIGNMKLPELAPDRADGAALSDVH
jgi:hypothetical protein